MPSLSLRFFFHGMWKTEFGSLPVWSIAPWFWHSHGDLYRMVIWVGTKRFATNGMWVIGVNASKLGCWWVKKILGKPNLSWQMPWEMQRGKSQSQRLWSLTAIIPWPTLDQLARPLLVQQHGIFWGSRGVLLGSWCTNNGCFCWWNVGKANYMFVLVVLTLLHLQCPGYLVNSQHCLHHQAGLL